MGKPEVPANLSTADQISEARHQLAAKLQQQAIEKTAARKPAAGGGDPIFSLEGVPSAGAGSSLSTSFRPLARRAQNARA
ncbi:MAG TPA: hypothetical protein VMG82_04010 [Candidatus Sulfotelmatobacter sp.]|nr:hypothetical protein [Candidatus Sulfotelmatobacter sp.]